MTLKKALELIKKRKMSRILKASLAANPTRTKESTVEAILGVKILTKKAKQGKVKV